MTDPKPQVERLMEAVTGRPRMRLVRLYTCNVCGKESEWGDGWQVKYRRCTAKEDGPCYKYYDPELIAYTCSDECKEKWEARDA